PPESGPRRAQPADRPRAVRDALNLRTARERSATRSTCGPPESGPRHTCSCARADHSKQASGGLAQWDHDLLDLDAAGRGHAALRCVLGPEARAPDLDESRVGVEDRSAPARRFADRSDVDDADAGDDAIEGDMRSAADDHVRRIVAEERGDLFV